MRDAFVSTLLEIAEKDSNVYLITGDLGFGILKPFWEKLPSQFLNLGIAEQNMTGFAAGMAMEGKIVFLYSIGNFPTLRCMEQIRNDCAYHQADVKIVSSGQGLDYGALGMSHHATEDIAMMRALPELTVMAPADISEVKYITRAIYKHKGTCYMRLGRKSDSLINHIIDDFQIGKAYQIKAGKGIAIFSTGAILMDVMDATELLNNNGIYPGIYAFPTIKPIDKTMIEACCGQYDLIVTVEEHNIAGGFGSAICEVVSGLLSYRPRILRIGIEDQYVSIVGSCEYLKACCKIDSAGIYQRIINFMQ
jgi:transketolase